MASASVPRAGPETAAKPGWVRDAAPHHPLVPGSWCRTANPSSWTGPAAGQEDPRNGALSYRGHPGVWPVLLNFTRVGGVRGGIT